MVNSPRVNLRSSRGSAAIASLAIVAIAMVIVSAAAMQTVGGLRLTRRSTDLQKAHYIAEAGAEYACASYASNPAWTGTAGAVSFGEGTYTVTVRNYAGGKVLESEGRLPNGVAAVIQVNVTTGSSTIYPGGAILSNGDITLSGGSFVASIPAGSAAAHVHANGDYKGGGLIEGTLAAVGSISNGQCLDPSYPNGRSGAPAMTFMAAAQITPWQNELIAEAQAGGSTAGNYSAGGVATLTGPLYINGDLSVGGGTLTIAGSSTVYVKGEIVVSGGGTIINSGLLASTGKIVFSGGSQYRVSDAGGSSGLVSFLANSKAIVLSGTSTSDAQGVVHAPNGGVEVSGGGYINGAIVAGGAGGLGKVTLSGGSSVRYPPGLMDETRALPGGGSKFTWVAR